MFISDVNKTILFIIVTFLSIITVGQESPQGPSSHLGDTSEARTEAFRLDQAATPTPNPTATPVVSCDLSIPAEDIDALISAIADANKSDTATTICLTESTYNLTEVNNETDGSNGLPSITSDITIIGNGATITRDLEAPAFRILHVTARGSLTLEDVTLSNGYADGTIDSGDGGAIRSRGTLTINHSTISENSAGNDGGGIYNNNSLTISDSTIANNNALDDGGALISESSSATALIHNSTIADNMAGDSGGGIYGDAGTITISQSTISGNHAMDSGGGISGNDTVIVIEDETLIANNIAEEHGGGIHTSGSDGQLLVVESTIDANSAVAGGGIYANNMVTIRASAITDNTTTDDGGGIRSSGTLIVEGGSVVSGNESGDDGAGIESSGILTVTDSIISSNTAVDAGGGVRNTGSIEDSSIHGSCIEENTAGSGREVYSSVDGFDATENWWGIADGPSGKGSGVGEMVNGNVVYDSFLTDGCPVETDGE
jgi:hypothetical protein